VVIPFEYDNAGVFFEGLAAVNSGGLVEGKYGLIDKKGKTVIKFIYDDIKWY